VLVADDNEVNLKVARMMLMRLGADVEVANDGAEAVAAWQRGGFDLILMDCQMPGMDGFEATRRIRTGDGCTPRGVPIIALTANALESDREACENAGMDDFMSKPFKATELVQLIERWIDLRSTVAS